MYTINRLEASKALWISIRSIDRYIKSWKIRSEKKWKIVLLNNEDIKNLSWGNNIKKVIVSSDIINTDNDWIFKQNDSKNFVVTFEKMYWMLSNEIKEKDLKIEDLFVKLWWAEERIKNSINIIEYKKVQFMYEEYKNQLSNELEKIKYEKLSIIKKLKHEKFTNILLIIFISILFFVWLFLFFFIV